ncbi:MAG TPA: hypothetical protein VJU61_13265, partial [Polyangiaceae bacterium]|nr:hypothetical protein [Polyangiaceae bacterium]
RVPRLDYSSLGRWLDGRLAALLDATPSDVLWAERSFSLVANVEYIFDFPGEEGLLGAPLEVLIEQMGSAAKNRNAVVDGDRTLGLADGPFPNWRSLRSLPKNQRYVASLSPRRAFGDINLTDHFHRCAICWPYAGLFLQMREAGVSGTQPLEPIWLARVKEVGRIVLLTRPPEFLQPLLFELAERVELPRDVGAALRPFAEDGRQQAILDWYTRAAPLYTYSPASHCVGEATQHALKYVVTALDHNAKAAALKQSTGLPTSTRRRWSRAGLPYRTEEERIVIARAMAKTQRHQLDGYRSQQQVAKRLKRSRSVVQRYTLQLQPRPRQDAGGTWRYSAEDIERLRNLLPPPRTRA